MQRAVKIIYILSVLFIIIGVLGMIFGSFLPIEITDKKISEFLNSLFFYGIPVAALFTLVKTVEKKDNWFIVLAKITLTFLAAVLFVFILTIALFFNMCDYTTTNTLFKHKLNSSKKIVEREYGCGATDSSPPTILYFEITEITPFLIWTNEIDIKTVRKDDWVSINSYEK